MNEQRSGCSQGFSSEEFMSVINKKPSIISGKLDMEFNVSLEIIILRNGNTLYKIPKAGKKNSIRSYQKK